MMSCQACNRSGVVMVLRQSDPRVEVHVCGEITCAVRTWFLDGAVAPRDEALAVLGPTSTRPARAG